MKFKKLFAAALALAISCGAVQTAAYYYPESFSAVAEEQDYTEVEENGIKYNVYSDHAIVKGASGKIEGELIIPDKINDVPVTSIGYSAFNMKDLITSVKIPYGVKTIYSNAFRSCRNLESVVLPDSVTVIESDAFSYCFKLESIVIPDSLEEISVSVFTSTPWLSKKREENPLVIVNNILIDGQTCNGRVEVPNNVKTIEYGAFGGSKSVTSIIIPESVINVKSAFSCCENLDSITFYNKNVLITDDAKTICNFVQTYKIKQETKIEFTGTIYGYEGSTAQAYAEKYGYKFEALKDEPETTTTTSSTTTTTTSTAKPKTTTTYTTKAPAKTTTTVKNTTTTAVTSKAPVTTTTVPVQTSKALGDFTGDGKIDAVDASNILAKYASISTGGTVPTEQDQAVCDVNGDKKIDAVDASKVLAFYAYLSGGGDMSFTDYLKEN